MNVLDPVSKVIKVRIVLQNPGYLLKPQMFASITVSNPEKGKEALCVPTEALIYERSRYYVIVYTGKGNASITPVEVINSLDNKSYLSSGVHEDDKVIASTALQIYSELNN